MDFGNRYFEHDNQIIDKQTKYDNILTTFL